MFRLLNKYDIWLETSKVLGFYLCTIVESFRKWIVDGWKNLLFQVEDLSVAVNTFIVFQRQEKAAISRVVCDEIVHSFEVSECSVIVFNDASQIMIKQIKYLCQIVVHLSIPVWYGWAIIYIIGTWKYIEVSVWTSWT